MTRQEMFDVAVGGVLRQGRFGWSEALDRCVYRGDNGCKCVVGQLIPDDKYDPAMDLGGEWIDELIKFRSLFDPSDYDFLIELQCAHDNAAAFCFQLDRPLTTSMADFRDRARIVAGHYGLSTAILDTIPEGAS